MTIHTRPDPLADRYSVRPSRTKPGSYDVYDRRTNQAYAGPYCRGTAGIFAAHMEAVHKRSRQQNEAGPVIDDFPEYERSASRWSVGDYQAEAARRTR